MKATMLTRLKRRLDVHGPGVTIGVIALVIALTGGAYAAAKGGLNATQKKQVKSIAAAEAKKYANSNPGAQGSKGDPGPAGKDGANGQNGTNGEDGKSVVVTPAAAGGIVCEGLGGAEVEEEGSDSPVEVCNGAQGEPGAEGEPWTPNNFLPSGAMETGTWAFTATAANTNGIRVPLPFFIPLDPLKENLGPGNVHMQGESNFADFCKGGLTVTNPEPGHLCVYANPVEGEFPNEGWTGTTFKGIYPASDPAGEEKGANRAGAMLVFTAPPTGVASGSGTYAVRAP